MVLYKELVKSKQNGDITVDDFLKMYKNNIRVMTEYNVLVNRFLPEVMARSIKKVRIDNLIRFIEADRQYIEVEMNIMVRRTRNPLGLVSLEKEQPREL